jgi:hypothetical protein
MAEKTRADVVLDELAVRGRCGFKQYIPSKPAKYGIKMFALVDAKTYKFNLETYVGTQPEGPYKQAIAEQKMERALAVAEKQREVANAKKRPETRNAECQTDRPKKEDADIVDIPGIQVETYEDFLAIQGKTWSAESFGATKVVVGNPIKENLENGQVRSGQVK